MAQDLRLHGQATEVLVQVQGGTSYTPQGNQQLFQDAGLSLAQELATFHLGFVKCATPAFFPNDSIYAEKGSRMPTVGGQSSPTVSSTDPIAPGVPRCPLCQSRRHATEPCATSQTAGQRRPEGGLGMAGRYVWRGVEAVNSHTF